MAGGYPCCCADDGSSSRPPPPPPPSSGSAQYAILPTTCTACIDGLLPEWVAVTIPGTVEETLGPDLKCSQICGHALKELAREGCIGSTTLVLKYRTNTRQVLYTPSTDGLFTGTIEEVWTYGILDINFACGYRFFNTPDAVDIEPCNCLNIECPAPPVPCCPNPPCGCADPCLFGEEYRTVAGIWNRPQSLQIVFRTVSGYGHRVEATVAYGCGTGVAYMSAFFFSDWSPTPLDCLSPWVLPLRQDGTIDQNCTICRGVDGPLIIEPLI